MRTFIIIIFILGLSSLTIFSIFQNPGLFPIHDDTQVVRIIEMSQALLDGQFPVRWVSSLGYGAGYPIFNFYSPLPYYFGAFIYLLTQNAILATKLMFTIGAISSFVFMYLLAREFIGDIAGFIPAVLYTYNPYHAVEIYVRGSVGEYWAYGLLPLVFLGVYKSVKTQSPRWVIFASLSLPAVLLSHNITGMISYIFAFVYLLIAVIFYIAKKASPKVIKPVVVSFVLALLISAFYLLPAISESKFTNVVSIIKGGSVYSDHFVYLDQLWDSPWGFAGSAPGREDGMTFKVGKIQFVAGLLGIVSLYYLYRQKKIKYDLFIIGNILAGFLFISIIMTTEFSVIIWNLLSAFFAYIQFPWRFLLFVEFFISFLSIYLLMVFKNKIISYTLVILFVVTTIVVNQKYFVPQTYFNYENSYYENQNYKTLTVSRISDEYLPDNFLKPSENNIPQLITSNIDLSFEVKNKKSNFIMALIESQSAGKVTLYNTYFPGWAIYVNEREVPITNTDGKIAFNIMPGINRVLVIFKGSPVQIIGNMISCITVLITALFFIKK